MTSESPFFDIHNDGDVMVIEFSRADVTDSVYIERLGDAIYHHVRLIKTPRIVVDLQKVQFLSSSALGMLVAVHKVMKKQSGEMRIANVSKDQYQAFKITKLHKLFKIMDSTEAAVKSLK